MCLSREHPTGKLLETKYSKWPPYRRKVPLNEDKCFMILSSDSSLRIVSRRVCGEINTCLALNQCNFEGSYKNTPKSKYL